MTVDPSPQEVMPATLYHYTTQEGLLGILRTGTLWATKLQYLNDFTEFKLAPEQARTILMERWQEGEVDETLSKLEALESEVSLVQQINVCGCAFSEEHDLLSQWRAYGGAAGGVCIGFATGSLEQLGAKQGFRLFRCVYDEETQRKAVESLISDTLERKFRVSSDLSGSDLSPDVIRLPTSSGLLLRLAGIAAQIKSYGFREEREWRLVTTAVRSDRLCFRPGRSMMVPFTKFVLGDDVGSYVNSITVGPCPDMGLACQAVRMFLAQLTGGDRVEVRGSAVPFRSW